MSKVIICLCIILYTLVLCDVIVVCDYVHIYTVTYVTDIVLKIDYRRANKTLSGVTNGNWRYMYIYMYMVHARYFSSAGSVLYNVGVVKCQAISKTE